jgi:Cysteine-rich CPCC
MEREKKDQKRKKFACHCCGFLTLEEEPLGTFEICPVCFWEDDDVQLREPTWTGANYVTLSEAKENFARFGASEERFKPFVRSPSPDEYPS